MLAVFEYVQTSDLRVSGRLHRWSPSRPAKLLVQTATHLGDGWLWLATAVVLASLYRFVELGALASAAGLANVAVIVLKRCFHRRRPVAFGLGSFPHQSQVLAFDHFSFPSGHALNAFAWAGVLCTLLPQGAPVWLLFASAVGASRVVLGFHFLSDVAAGAMLGLAAATAALYLVPA